MGRNSWRSYSRHIVSRSCPPGRVGCHHGSQLIAHHAAIAGMTDKAITYWRQAGIVATAQPAYQEAIAHLTNALSLVQQEGESRSRLESELDLQVLRVY